ncbi:MAG: zinc ribbon domain-containing protein [Prosthecobacter sp.]
MPELLSLQCPSCGHANNEITGEHAFGAEVHCRACGTTSALIVTQQLHLKKAGERVCKDCGRVASAGAEFCQCRQPLLKRCVGCEKKLPVDDHICPRCGWNHDPKLATEEAMNDVGAALNKALDERRYADCKKLEMDLLSSVVQRASLTTEAERAYKRLVLAGFESAVSPSNRRWSDLRGFGAIWDWDQKLDRVRDKLDELADTIHAAAQQTSNDGCEAVVLTTLAAVVALLFVGILGLIPSVLALILVAVGGLVQWRRHQDSQKAELGRLFDEHKKLQSQWQAWLREFNLTAPIEST